MNFKKFCISAAFGVIAAAGASTSSEAATKFDFSYTFHDDSGALTNDAISGSFFGTLTGSLVTNIFNASASFNGAAMAGPLNVYSYTPTYPNCGSADCYTLGGAMASFNGQNNNFVFIDSAPDANNHLTTFTNYFYIIQPWANGGPGSTTIATQFSSPTALVESYNGDYFANSFTLSAVPEPAAWMMLLLGFGAIGWTMRSRRKQAFAAA